MSKRVFSPFSLLLLGLLVNVCLMVWYLKIKNETHPPAPRNATKLILSWVPFFGDPYYAFGSGKSAFERNGCSWTNCEITDDRLRVPQHDFDALLFHGFEFYTALFGKPRHRSPHQYYVFMSLESSRRTSVSESFQYFFNVTMTYRLDSDMPWPYFVVRDKATGARVAPDLDVRWPEPSSPPLDRADWQRTLEIVRGKAQPARAAWFVSNCHSKSDREMYAHELARHMPVDVYGACGQYKCPSTAHPNCSQLLTERYHFYLAFENSLCEDYLTEKVLHGLGTTTVPVVLSGAKLSRFLPPRSYIDAYGVTPAQLAERLTQLAADPEQFAQYLWWRDHYTIERTMPGDRQDNGTHPLCSLCALLHGQTSISDRNREFTTWWMNDEISNSTEVSLWT